MDKEARKFLNPQGEKLVEILQASDEEIANSTIAELSRQREELATALRELLSWSEGQICSHEERHRGGAIWTICSICGKKWADDQGGFVQERKPKSHVKARAVLAKL